MNILVIFLATSCINQEFPILEFSENKTETYQIRIKEFKSDSNLIFQDPVDIEKLFFMLGTSRRDLRKFIPNYVIFIGDKKLLINSYWINYKGITYKSKKNIELFIRNLKEQEKASFPSDMPSEG